MSFRSKIMTVPVLSIGSGLFVWGAAYLWGLWAALGVAAAAVFAVVLLTRNLLLTSADSVDRMNRTLKALTDGKMDVTLRAAAERESGEVGILENGLAALALSHHNFKNDMEALVARAQAGEGPPVLETKHLSGWLRDLAAHINAIASSCEKTNTALIAALDAFTRGDFNPTPMLTHPRAAEAVGALARQLQTVKNDTGVISAAAKEGRLNARTGGTYAGEWTRISADLNATLDALNRPVNEIASVLERFEGANFLSGLSSHFQGDFVKVKEALERVGVLFAGHLNELSSALSEVSYGREARLTREYRGAFQGLQSGVQSVARAYERLALDLERAKAAGAAAAARVPFGAAARTPVGSVGAGTAGVRPTVGAGTAGVRPTVGAAAPAARTPTPVLRTPLGTAAPATPARPKPPVSANAPVLPVGIGKVITPSGAHEYNRKDFGKYK